MIDTQVQPYRPVLDGISCDLSHTTFYVAAAKWLDVHGRAPTVLRVSSVDEEFAKKLLAITRNLRLELRVKPDFAEDEWAVGDNSDMGFGSTGA